MANKFNETERSVSKFDIFFSKLFPKVILKNEIVATVILTIGEYFKSYKNKVDNVTNNDI